PAPACSARCNRSTTSTATACSRSRDRRQRRPRPATSWCRSTTASSSASTVPPGSSAATAPTCTAQADRAGVDVFLQFTVAGLATGCIYALTATGLTVTYITSGIFNFAHGAVGMIAAFAYWELTIEHGWPQPFAVLFVLLVLAPVMGLLLEQLMRRLHGAPTDVTL